MTTSGKESQNDLIYRERVIPGPGAFIPLALILPTGYLTFTPINASLGIFIGIFGTLLAAGLLILLAPVIELSGESLRVGKAVVPRTALGKAVSIPAEEAFAERGPKLHARAFIKFQPTVKTLIKVEITDESDPTPYLLFSTRHAADLARKING